MRILVADDDRLLRDLLRFRLEARGFAVEEAADGGAALERLARPPLPDAVVLDAMMPEVDGLGVLRRVREDPATAELPVILLTARRGEQDVVEALRLGASDYLTKPFLPDELVLRLQRLVARRGSGRIS
jgi:DNA-binding response OmpR family regulator